MRRPDLAGLSGFRGMDDGDDETMTTPDHPPTLVDLAALDVAGTPGPLRWHKMGNEYVLWGDHGMRPIVLDCHRGQLRCRQLDRCVMVPLDPQHPDMAFIAAAKGFAPRLLADLRALDQKWRKDAERESERGYGECAQSTRACADELRALLGEAAR